ncbi:uncharacterized protein A4U43_C07F1610 [Asparagus officinalis]|uniref:Uncharacterized protein n=1 Tax=Asparagus officinalis TaxID=4686 RepID=A0A5P1EDI2_ASPOF|nr:uncharacterized protein A4U43_C07F1610 [Asparagus officinalis]
MTSRVRTPAGRRTEELCFREGRKSCSGTDRDEPIGIVVRGAPAVMARTRERRRGAPGGKAQRLRNAAWKRIVGADGRPHLAHGWTASVRQARPKQQCAVAAVGLGYGPPWRA